MYIEYENIIPDENSSLRILHLTSPAEQFVWQYHYHPEIELVCIFSGSGVRHVGNHISRYENGDLLLIGPNVPHSGFGLNATNPHEEIVVHFKESLFSFFFESTIEAHECKNMMERAKMGISFSGKTFENISKQMRLFVDSEPEVKLINLIKILIELSKSKDFECLNKDITLPSQMYQAQDRLKVIMNHIESYFGDPIEINDLATKVNMSIPAFSAFFKRYTNMTFTDFLNNFRIQKACSFLYNGKNVSEACYSSGYNSVSYFSRIFKKHIGITPKEYKDKIRPT